MNKFCIVLVSVEGSSYDIALVISPFNTEDDAEAWLRDSGDKITAGRECNIVPMQSPEES